MSRYIDLVDMLRRIPTGDNAQPFRYVLSQNTLEVFHLKDVAKHKFNQKQVASLMSLGMITFIINNYSRKNNMLCKFEFASNFNDEERWLRCIFTPANTEKASNEDEDLLTYLLDRKTDRGVFFKEQIDLGKFRDAFKDSIHFENTLSPEGYKMVTKYESMILDDLDAYRDIVKWVRFSKKEVESTRTGMSRQNLGLDAFTGFLFKLYAKDTFLNLLLKPYFRFIIFMKTQVFVKRAGGYGLCVLKDSSDKSIIDLGGQIIKAWLMLTKEGLSVQPVSSPSLISFLSRNRSASFLKEYETLTNKCSEIFNRDFKSSGEIIWLFRFGRPVMKMKNPTLRLTVEEITSHTKVA